MKIVDLLPESKLLVIFDDITGDVSFIKLHDDRVRRLSDQFQIAVELLPPPSQFRVLGPIHLH